MRRVGNRYGLFLNGGNKCGGLDGVRITMVD